MECIAIEEPWLRAHAVAPGIVDTDMQATIRATPAEVFPVVDRFIGFKERDEFNSPAWVAQQVLDLVGGPKRDDVVVRIADEPR
jgi:benzil reductase ((S)-benzoin forming)